MINIAADVFNARLAQANLIIKTDFNTKFSSLDRQITEINQKIYLLKISWKSYKRLIRAILLARSILKKIVYKTI